MSGDREFRRDGARRGGERRGGDGRGGANGSLLGKERRSRRRNSSDETVQRDLDREPPFNLEAEVAVLGSIMLLPDVCDEVINIVLPLDFYDESNRVIYQCMLDMHNSQQKIDITLLRERLIANGDFEQVGGAAYLAEIFERVPTAAHAKYYAEIVREKSTVRQVIYACSDILENSYAPEADSEQTLNEAEQKIFAIREQRGEDSVVDIKQLLLSAMDRLDARMAGEQADGAVDTGFTELDNLTGGLRGSELVILAARPSMGKTAFAMNIAEHVSIALKQPTLFVSLEMSSIELIERLLCSVSRVNSHRLRNGSISQDDRKKLVKKASEVSQSPLFIDDSPSRTVAQIAAVARRLKRSNQDKLGLIVIDYLQLIEPDNSSDPRQEQVAKIARRLKGLARELEAPVLCLSQLNRQAEDSRDHRPKLSHLRESGAIEQDADVVMFVHREEYYRRGAEREEVAGEAQILIEKQRNGPTGDVNLVWRREYTRFENRAPERNDEFDDFGGGGFNEELA